MRFPSSYHWYDTQILSTQVMFGVEGNSVYLRLSTFNWRQLQLRNISDMMRSQDKCPNWDKFIAQLCYTYQMSIVFVVSQHTHNIKSKHFKTKSHRFAHLHILRVCVISEYRKDHLPFNQVKLLVSHLYLHLMHWGCLPMVSAVNTPTYTLRTRRTKQNRPNDEMTIK